MGKLFEILEKDNAVYIIVRRTQRLTWVAVFQRVPIFDSQHTTEVEGTSRGTRDGLNYSKAAVETSAVLPKVVFSKPCEVYLDPCLEMRWCPASSPSSGPLSWPASAGAFQETKSLFQALLPTEQDVMQASTFAHLANSNACWWWKSGEGRQSLQQKENSEI